MREHEAVHEDTVVRGEAARAEMRKRSRRDFLIAGVAVVGGYAAWRAIDHAKPVDELQSPLREAEQFNAAVSRRVLGDRALAPTFPLKDAVQDVRVNGDIGIDPALDLNHWRLQVVGLHVPASGAQSVKDVNSWKYQDLAALAEQADNTDALLDDQDDSKAAPEPGLLLSMAELRTLPHVGMTTQLKCIEGWSEIVNWGGVRMRDFIERYVPAAGAKYVGLETPDQQYYVGLDYADAVHPQTLLCYEINGQPLSREHGAPLRLVTPLKYGIKHIKQIGRISFTDQRARDYWAENGYDWHSGH